MKLEPCLFCGGDAVLFPAIPDSSDPYVACGGGTGKYACDAKGPSAHTEADAIAAWNRRALSSSGSAAPVAVKALEWAFSNRRDLSGNLYWRGQTAFDWGYRVYFEDSVFVLENKNYPTLDEAKAAAQADYEARIHSALSASPSPEQRA